MFDIITFGSATQDVFLKSKKFRPVSDERFPTGKGVCFNLGSKIEIEDIFFASGGGGTNSAATFAQQGFKTAYCGQIGNDCSGDLVLDELKRFGVYTGMIKRTTEKATNFSLILLDTGAEKTILTYRGASDSISKNDIPWEKIKNTKWFYLAPFSRKLADLTLDIVTFAKKNNIKIAFNPGKKQLSLPPTVLAKILKLVDILILNQEEASELTKINFKKEKEIFRHLDKMVCGICIMTKGDEGVVVSDGNYIYNAPTIIKKNVADSTGAGDSFGSGFVSDFFKKQNIESAIQMGIANSVSNLQKIGAKEGLLKKDQKFIRVNVSYEKL